MTATTLNVGTSGTVFNASSSSGKVGIGTTVARTTFDVEGTVRLKTHYENVGIVTSVSNVLTLDLSTSNSFTCTIDQAINKVTITNPLSEASSFTIKFLQDSTGGFAVKSPSGSSVVGIETFYNADDDAIPLLWPGGGVIPVETTGAGKSDIYSFRTFDGGSTFYGVVGGQNFA